MATSSACAHSPVEVDRRKVLHQHGHQVGPDDHPAEQVAVGRARRDVGGEVPWIDVGDGCHEGRAEQEEARSVQLPLKGRRCVHGSSLYDEQVPDVLTPRHGV
jgi:hypothetical protein